MTDSLVCDGYLGIKHESDFNCVWVNSSSSFSDSFALPETTLSAAPFANSILQMGQMRGAYSDVGVQ